MGRRRCSSLSKVVTDLFEKGAARVKITGTDIDVYWPQYKDITSDKKSTIAQNVNVDVVAVARSSSSISIEFREIEEQLSNYDIDSDKIPEAKKQIKALENELKKRNPKWNVIKQVLGWALNFSKDLFLRLIVIYVEHRAQGL